ncbi:gamma-glutamyltransferase [Flammeovirga agarivorans]|uniref:Glutathione hydrolase proenzyme n=1 Tax=Flammeovirga agarivorans TaxID=2726742 RepID=A0A7X8XW57_9BACT|nr:gamma-glutamyltransferase [Flammeovirga agarivorans]NLR91894.1 gamma-glutamyltransferase [Flammeovirga agarivorans]
MKKIYTLILLHLTFLISCQQKNDHLTHQNTGPIGKHGMVSTAHPLATKIGLEILKKGGNAFDAAVATHFALAVAYPRAGNIGGGGFMVYRTESGVTGSLDFREKAPHASTTTMYLDDNGEPIKDLSLKGLKAAGVPGSVDGMVKMHEKLGLLDWQELLSPAIQLAKDGVKLTAQEAEKINQYADDFKAFNHFDYPFNQKGKWNKGDVIYYPNLAKTLALIQNNKRNGFYTGTVAHAIVTAMKEGNGIITKEDLAEYHSEWRKPIEVTFQDSLKMISMPPPSSGGITLGQILKGMDMIDPHNYAHNSSGWVHHVVELERRAYADRATHIGDADFYPVPIDTLLSDDYIYNRISTIKNDQATNSQEIKAGNVQNIESFETTHFSIVDKMGNAVSITTTLNGNFGCKVFIQEAGFFMNNEMDDFSIKPGTPNQFGLVGGEANKILPNKRMLSSMTPTIVEKNGELFLVVGTPGGSTIITSVLQTILNVTQFGMTMQEAVDAKKFHSQWLPDIVYYEDGAFSKETISTLKKFGHHLETTPQLGKMDCIRVLEDGSLEGASDNTRGDGCALGY